MTIRVGDAFGWPRNRIRSSRQILAPCIGRFTIIRLTISNMAQTMNKEFIKHRGDKYIRDGIMSDIKVTIIEKPRHTFLGSTDRKGYTLECTATYLDRQYSTFVNIEPFFDEKETAKLLDMAVEESRQKIAGEVYKELFNN